MHPALNQQLQAAHALELSTIRRHVSSDHSRVPRQTSIRRLGFRRVARAR